MTKINPSIFKAYDVRGVYPKEINSSAALNIAKGLVAFLGKRKKGRLKIVVARDNRVSSPVLYRAVKKGILGEGVDIIDIGLSTTPMFYFAVWKYKFDGGIIVTASHNPPEYNGFKIVGEKAISIGEENGLEEIKKLTLQKKKRSKAKKGSIWKKNILKEYLDFNFSISKMDFKKLKAAQLKIGIDTANAVSGILVKELKKRLPCKIYHLFPKLDGRFPNHLANPLEEKNIKDLRSFVKRKNLDLGVAFDGDGDRIIFVAENGKTIVPDYITCLLSQKILEENPGAKILYSICSSNIIREIIRENGGVPIPSKIGHTLIKGKMIKEKALFAGEYSGHYFHRDHSFCEVPLIVLFEVLEKISKTGKSISQLIIPFKKYFYSGIINLEVKDKPRALSLLKRRYKRGKISHLDGLRVDFEDWWFNARPSNTEDLLRIAVEAKTKSLMQGKLKKIKKLITAN
ncbi:phosphomannomutase/phosphoglucomutase [Candidatus Atribacteria bacterium MT.SAG.1]|nr:phosphomannomutase/phosphoglucomutase [Candidatus Atribacteria bacterium MT.SAG.1]